MLPQEECVCLRCLPLLPRVHAEAPHNEVENRLFGRFPFEHATSFCYYDHDAPVSGIVRQAKYAGRPWLNTEFTRLFVRELELAAQDPLMNPLSGTVDPLEEGTTRTPAWPYDIDLIVPIPLHTLRLLRRGYNQAVAIAEALHEEWHLPIETRCLYKRRYTTSQVGLSGHERLHHEEETFGVRHPERLASRHVLLVDDVLTTGATLTAAADALLAAVPGVRLSILTLSFARG